MVKSICPISSRFMLFISNSSKTVRPVETKCKWNATKNEENLFWRFKYSNVQCVNDYKKHVIGTVYQTVWWNFFSTRLPIHELSYCALSWGLVKRRNDFFCAMLVRLMLHFTVWCYVVVSTNVLCIKWKRGNDKIFCASQYK